MDSEYILTQDNELIHWGIKGMRWGQRRYQNKDGSLTPAGKKRYDKETEELKARERIIKNKERVRAKLDKLDAKKAELAAREKALKDAEEADRLKKLGKKVNAEDETPKVGPDVKKKSAKNMTDDELREHTNRLNLEKQYLDAVKSARGETKGRKFLDTLSDKLVSSLAERMGDNTADVAVQAMKSIGAKYVNDLVISKFDGAEQVHANNKKK